MTNGSVRDGITKIGTALVTAAVLGVWAYVVNLRADVNMLTTEQAVIQVHIQQIAIDVTEIKTDVKAIRRDGSVTVDPTLDVRFERMEQTLLRLQCVSLGRNDPTNPYCRNLR